MISTNSYTGVLPGWRAVIVDPHREWVGAVERILTTLGIAVVATETNPRLALAKLERERPDLLLVRLGASSKGESEGGSMESVECLILAKQRLPALKGIVFGECADRSRVEAAFAAGAAAYVVQTAGLDEVASAIRQAFSQSIHFGSGNPQNPPVANGLTSDELGLTPREREVLGIVAEGHTNADTAKMLFVTEQTVKYHLSNVYTKLDVSNRTQASRWAHEHGLLRTALA
jgi:NarL family two-component system response regulator LiaR